MFIVFGFRTRPSKVGEGDFYCPRCGADRHYVLQRFRRWFTLFFLPVFPVSGGHGEQVRCRTCNTAYRPEVLQAPTSARLTETIRDTMRLAAVAVLSAGNGWDSTARQMAVEAIVSAGAPGYNEGSLTQDLDSLDVARLPNDISQLAQGLNTQGKETFVTQVAKIAIADGPIDEGEQAVLNTVGAGLGLSSAHLLGIVTAAARSPRY